ncbi:polysaccharide deacetylase family protein [Actinocrispum sp. NPDC049592]|uniref:polysaccharide deacetylase family protein n=1 Tax=Actinocrispum sp. NPDC049592 TaxID=3154835 RepID=UPI00342DB415
MTFLKRLRGVGDPTHVALTFDDGPDRQATPQLLDLLASRGVTATFFLIGIQVRDDPGLAKEIAAAGHEIAVHGWEHRCLLYRSPRATHQDIAAAHELIGEVIGAPLQWYRPPYGVLTWPAYSAARRLGLTPVLWTAWGRDWSARATPTSVFRTVTRSLRGGGTVLLHDSDRFASPGSWRSMLGAVPLLLDECERRGLTVGPLGEHGLV